MTGALNTPLRSLLFVPGDSERKLEKGIESKADALILDLEDAVAPSRTAVARGMVLEYLKSRPERSRQKLWVRINPLTTPAAMLDLAAVVAGAPDGILLPKVNGPLDIVHLGHCLDALEVREGLASGLIRIMPVATETPQSLFALGGYAGCSDRLHGLTWGAEDIAAALGASANRRPTGEYDTVYAMAKALCLSGAAAANVQPVDTIWADYRDNEGLLAEAKLSRQSGYTGKIAIHPGQVNVINEAFTPGPQEVAWSRRVVEVFEANPGLGTVGLEGKMLDMPHLKQARRVLELVDRVGAK
ncbi:HpcH/HpaI aldolase/citrate lyase family protein [Ottowia thiooxydans]|uniref:Citrate lyase subunit beta/citryl-CoA lyase n=1 Tax=Ottowia thiooxydans TaxID=219182 RepID=A0ABV2QC38_9BURK